MSCHIREDNNRPQPPPLHASPLPPPPLLLPSSCHLPLQSLSFSPVQSVFPPFSPVLLTVLPVLFVLFPLSLVLLFFFSSSSFCLFFFLLSLSFLAFLLLLSLPLLSRPLRFSFPLSLPLFPFLLLPASPFPLPLPSASPAFLPLPYSPSPFLPSFLMSPSSPPALPRDTEKGGCCAVRQFTLLRTLRVLRYSVRCLWQERRRCCVAGCGTGSVLSSQGRPGASPGREVTGRKVWYRAKQGHSLRLTLSSRRRDNQHQSEGCSTERRPRSCGPPSSCTRRCSG